MKFSAAVLAGLPALALARPSDSPKQAKLPEWHPPTADDDRSPCPMLNTLANHDILPHDGKGYSREIVVGALAETLNLDEEFAAFLFEGGLELNPDQNASSFDLEHLKFHNGIEHDASLSRSDAYFGDNHSFNETVFDRTLGYWSADTVTVEMMANAGLASRLESRSTNPEFSFPAVAEQLSLSEMAFPFIIFGDREAVTFERDVVESFFVNERLPEGWTTPEEVADRELMGKFSAMVAGALNFRTDQEST